MTATRPPTRMQALAGKLMAAGLVLALVAMISAVVWSLGAGRVKPYPQSTPDDVLRSAVEMIKNGDTRRLPSLIYADGPDMRSALNQLGRLLEGMQRLSASSARAFPAEFAQLQAEAAAAAADPNNNSLISQVFAGMNEFGSDGRASPGRQPNADDVRAGFSALLADPFGWVDRNAARLSTVKTADDTAAIMFDGQPAIPVVGLPMKQEDGRWYIVLPLNIPPVSNVAPRTKDQWSILGSSFKVLENAANALEDDVRHGRVSSLKNLVDRFQEKVLFPIALAFGPYAKEMDVRSRVERRTSALKARQRAWVDARKKNPPPGAVDAEPGRVSSKVPDAIATISFSKIEPLVRANKPFPVDKMSDPEFEEMIGAWFREEGLAIKVDGDLAPAVVDATITTWQADRRAKASGKPAPKRP